MAKKMSSETRKAMLAHADTAAERYYDGALVGNEEPRSIAYWDQLSREHADKTKFPTNAYRKAFLTALVNYACDKPQYITDAIEAAISSIGH